MTCNLRTRPAAVLLIIGMLGCAGCERSQPGPKPISGTASGTTSERPGAATPATPANPTAPGAPASSQAR
ncbi:hypothetical protein D3C72_1780000 [compost metagenome]